MEEVFETDFSLDDVRIRVGPETAVFHAGKDGMKTATSQFEKQLSPVLLNGKTGGNDMGAMVFAGFIGLEACDGGMRGGGVGAGRRPVAGREIVFSTCLCGDRGGSISAKSAEIQDVMHPRVAGLAGGGRGRRWPAERRGTGHGEERGGRKCRVAALRDRLRASTLFPGSSPSARGWAGRGRAGERPGWPPRPRETSGPSLGDGYGERSRSTGKASTGGSQSRR